MINFGQVPDRTPSGGIPGTTVTGTFLLHHAIIAEQTGAGALILGEPAINPALPGGINPDGSSSGVPEDSNSKWRNLISEIRQIYHGPIIWALSYPGDLNNLPEFIHDVDQFYVLFSAPLGNQEDQTPQEYAESISKILANEVLNIKQKYNKPILIGLSYPSATGSARGCVLESGFCERYDALSPFTSNSTSDIVDLNEQMEIYNGALLAVNDLAWIDGIVSRGYYPPAPLHDSSTSIHGKPAADVLWYWFRGLDK